MRTTIKIDMSGKIVRSGKMYRLKIAKHEYATLYELLTLVFSPDFEFTVNGREVDDQTIQLNEKTLWMRFEY